MADQFDAGPLVRALAQFGERVQRDAQARIEQAAQQTARRAIQSYPLGPTGNLKRGVTWGRGTARPGGGVMYGTSGVLGAWTRSAAPHAWLYEHGHRQRRNRALVPRPVVARIAPEERAAMFADLQQLVAREAGRV